MSGDPHGFLIYLDPGTGSVVLQLLLGGVAGALVFLKFQGRRLRAIFGRLVSATGRRQKGST